VTRGMLGYSLGRSQDQTEEVEAEGTYLKTKINLKSQKSQTSLCWVAHVMFLNFEEGMVSRGIKYSLHL
jgi:hypothetical protein